MLLCICLLVTLFPITASAAVTQSDAVSWARAQVNRTGNCDVDGNGLWCTDLATAYINYCWLRANGDNRDPWGLYPYTTKMAYAYDDYLRPNVNWTVIARTASTIPQPGDLFVCEQDSVGYGYGHVGVVLSVNGSKSAEIVQMSGGKRPFIETVTWGSTASYNPQYFIRFNYFTPDHTHSYNSSTHKCSCGQFDPNYLSTGSESGLYVVTKSGGTYLRTAPYAAATDSQRFLNYGEKITVTGSVVNKDNQRWYKISGFGNTCYLKASDAGVYVEPFTATIDLKLEKTTMREGENNNLIGTVKANYDNYVLQASKAISPSEDQYVYASFTGSKSVAIKSTAANQNADFSHLKAGTYAFQLQACYDGEYINSKLATLTVLPSTATPKASIVAVEGGKEISFSCETAGADIYYTTNGATPSASSSKYTSTLFFDTTVNLRAIAIKNGTKSSEFSQTVTVNPAAAPSIFTEYTADGTRITIDSESGSKVYYSLGGDYHQYTVPLTVTSETEVSAFAEKLGCTKSETVSESAKVALPECPSFSSPANGAKIAQKQPITVSWNRIYNASSYTLNVYKNGTLSDSIETAETTYIYVAEEAANYSFRVQAKNVIGMSDFSSEVGIFSMAPVTVSFTDWDATVVWSQTVDYNTAYDDIQKPTDPERRGYTFLYWGNRYYSNITEDLTIQACYKINTYKVTFLDQNGNRIGSQQTVEYDCSAQKPDVSSLSLPTGFALLGWNVQAEAADSNCDFTHVDSNMTVKAIVGWGEPELPVVAKITSAKRDDDNSNGNYEITVRLTNYPDAFTTALLRVSLKTAEGKMVKTESRTVGLKANETNDFSFTINYSGTATKVEAVCLGYDGDYLTGSAYSKAVSSDVTVISDYVYGSWSGWSTTKPSTQANREIESKVQYAYKTKSTKTSNSPTLSGWTLEKTVWGNWSGWQDSAITATASREVKTQSVVASYNMETYVCGNSSGTRCYLPWMQSGYTQRAHYTATFTPSQLASAWSYAQGTYYNYASNVAGYIIGPGTAYLDANYVPFYAVSINYKTQYSYRDATYHFYKISDFSAWQDSAVSVGGNICEVKTRTLYRYRDKNVPQYQAVSGIEDTSGEFYSLSGTLPVEGSCNLKGKLATVMVYKGKNSDPNESQLQYVGQTTIGSNNSYSLRFKTKDVPSIATGDFVICLGIQGSTGLVNVGIISAPKESYSVNYYDINGNKIGKTQSVESGCDAIAPAAPAVEGYTFVAWSETGRNIHGDLDITAIYVPITYAVVFVDWQNGTALPYALPYGTSLTEYAESLAPYATGYDFLYWDALHDGQNSVTGNMVISAVYEPEKYTVNFYDGKDSSKKLISSQQVAYGEDAQLPDIPTYENRVFIAWDTSTPWWDVTGNVDVCAITAYTLTAEEPVSNLGDFAVGMAETLELSAGENALIYYTTNGTDPIPGENGTLYVAGIPLTDTTEVRAVAVEDGKNDSEVIVVEFYYDEGFDGEFYEDIRTIETYEPIVKANDTVELTLRINKNPGLLGSLFFVDCDTSVYYLDCIENGEYAYTPGEIASDGMFVVAPYENGWKVLFFGSEAITGDGSLFSLKLKVNPDAISGTYPITVSYSAENMLGTDYLEKEVSCESVISGTVVRGDINGDGEMTLADVVMILRHVVGLDVLSGLTALNAADVNNDGSINVVDALRLARYIAGLESSLR